MGVLGCRLMGVHRLMLNAHGKYQQLLQQLMQLIDAGQFDEAIAFRDGRFTQVSEQMTDALNKLADSQRDVGQQQATTSP